jgi:hypothetical protein
MKGTLVICVMVALSAATAIAAPSHLVTKPPVGPPPTDAPTGPTQDPWALQGQWCQDGVRTHEFYDNKYLDGGNLGTPGVPGSTKAIYGKVTDITWNAGKITAFTITATISNPNTDPSGEWAAGGNDHYPEYLWYDGNYYRGTLYDTVLTASFACRLDPSSGQPMIPGSWTGPYTDVNPKIYAVSEDMGAWYCWNPEAGDPYLPAGNYFVPAWNFGDIEPGQSVTKDLDFGVRGTGLPSSDPRYDAIMHSYQSAPGDGDIFLNRTTSLKISDWMDQLCVDEGIAYPTDTGAPITDPNGYVLYDPGRNSDVSVFHNIPEPLSLVLLAVGGIGLIRRRRK